MNFSRNKVASTVDLGVIFFLKAQQELLIMNPLLKTLIIPAILLACPVAMVDNEKDCLLEGTVMHGAQGSQDATSVKITSISNYDAESRCNVKRGAKMEFKLPQDTRLKQAPSGSDVKYRYRTDDAGQSETQLISVGA